MTVWHEFYLNFLSLLSQGTWLFKQPPDYRQRGLVEGVKNVEELAARSEGWDSSTIGINSSNMLFFPPQLVMHY